MPLHRCCLVLTITPPHGWLIIGPYLCVNMHWSSMSCLSFFKLTSKMCCVYLSIWMIILNLMCLTTAGQIVGILDHHSLQRYFYHDYVVPWIPEESQVEEVYPLSCVYNTNSLQVLDRWPYACIVQGWWTCSCNVTKILDWSIYFCNVHKSQHILGP